MNIQTVIHNLNHTIEGKERFKAELEASLTYQVDRERKIANNMLLNYLNLNLDELKRIRDDLLNCN